MSSMPEPTQPVEQINDTVRAAMATLVAAGLITRESADALLSLWARGTRGGLTPVELAAITDAAQPQHREDCPDWCLFDHARDDARDDLVLHQGADHTDGTTRKLLDVHNGSVLDVRVARTDCPPEGRTGTPALMIRADLEVTTWEQAAELARTILDGFGYLQAAEE